MVVGETAIAGNLVGSWIDLWELMQLHARGDVTLQTETHPLDAVNDVLDAPSRRRGHRPRRARPVNAGGRPLGAVGRAPAGVAARAVHGTASAHDDYDALWRWSVADLEGFWAAVWDFFEIGGVVRPRARSAGDAGSRVVPGRAPELRRAHARSATTARSRSSPARSRATRSNSPSASCATRSHGRGPASSGSASAPGDRVVAYLPNIPETLVAFLAAASLGAVWATCPPEFGVRSVVDRLGQLEPKVLLAVAGYRYGDKLVDRREQVAGDPRRPACPRGRRPCPLRRGSSCLTPSPGTSSSPSRGRSSSRRCRSTIRSTSSSRRGRPACRRRSSTGTAGSWSSI